MGGSASRIKLPPALASATYDANNRLTNQAGTTLTYDFNGNLIILITPFSEKAKDAQRQPPQTAFLIRGLEVAICDLKSTTPQ